MGDVNLHSFFMRNMKKHQFRDSKLIIDGSDLYHTLYFKSQLDQEHGGEYDAFAKEVSNFFSKLKECNIKPYVFLDGGDSIREKTFDSLKQRVAIRIRKAHALSEGRPRNVLPILIKNMFLQLLSKLNVPHIQSIAEAKWEAAALANDWNCPVLSNKMDFYIFDLKAGFLPLCHFQWKMVTSVKHSDKKFIPARLFSVKTLCVRLKHMNKDVLPVFATILANDFAHLNKKMFSVQAKPSVSEELRHVDGLLTWLSRFPGPAEAICALVNSMTNLDDSVIFIKSLTEGMQKYRLTSSSTTQFFLYGKPQSRLTGLLENLPEWTLQLFFKGKLDSFIINVLAMQKAIFSFPVENSQCSSSNLTSQPIRQAIYALLLCTRQQDDRGHSTPAAEVEEYDRQGLSLTSSRVAAVLPSQANLHFHLETLWEVSWHLRRQIFLDTLCVFQVPERLLVLPSLQLAIYVTCYWLKHAKPEPRPEFLWALLIGLVYGELARDPRTGKWTVPTRLKDLKSHKDKMEKRPLDQEAAHAYNQWQCTLRDSICLSQLLANPVPEPEYAWLYSGVLVHRVTGELQKGKAPESLLAGSSHALQLYQQLKEAVERELDEDMRTRFQAGGQSPGEHAVSEECSEDLSNLFKHLIDNEEEDDKSPRGRKKKSKGSNHDDMNYNETCTIRTRHRSRSHKADPKSKKYERAYWE